MSPAQLCAESWAEDSRIVNHIVRLTVTQALITSRFQQFSGSEQVGIALLYKEYIEMPQMIGAAAGGLKPCKRYIATHNDDGKSVYTESPDQLFNAVPGFGGLARSFSVNSVPANLTGDADIKAYRAEEGATSYTRREIVNPEPGANLLVVDLEPGAMSAMHRTVSIDFSICVQGEIDHELDGGEKVRLHPGVRLP